MVHQEISCGLEYAITPDLQMCIAEAIQAKYAFIVTPIIHPRYRRPFLLKNRVGGFTRSDMILSPQDWTTRIVARISPYIDVDANTSVVKRRHEDCLIEELQYCRGVGVPAIMLNIRSKNNVNLARILHTFQETSHHTTYIWACVPMYCASTSEKYKDSEDEDIAYNETWSWWSKFHEYMKWDKRVGVVLEVSADLPSQDVIQRWLGEPVKAIILPTHIFINNKKGYPVLSKAHQSFVTSMVEHDAQVIVSGARRSNMEHYLQYLHRIWQRRTESAHDPMLNFARGWEDYLQTPLQPLSDNLDTHTYNVFEKDPIKYDQYQKAIVSALTELKKKKKVTGKTHLDNQVNAAENNEPVVVMVLGAGRGPLVRATFNAADKTNTNVKVIVVEKNPSAVVVLADQVHGSWRDRDVSLIHGDMRYVNLTPKADIIVSELLGSWADNELSPECLDGASNLLKPGGISIPCQYRSFVTPISSPRLWIAAKMASTGDVRTKEKNLEKLWVVFMRNKHDIADCKPVFTFEHPAKPLKNNDGEDMFDHRGSPMTDNRRDVTITWDVKQDNVMHGFGGYFDCQLFGNETLSIVPATHSPGMISWFPVFIPIKVLSASLLVAFSRNSWVHYCYGYCIRFGMAAM
ncbi:unnamed protein product [Leptidea sinapis]|uniref:Protein arginine N-methyltransferase n=1 Tax=Leptidea sinapis TaxID=189913 RepID=A0A5E4Q0N9_9NEOP|nr:unnamed protein product [Leptidea sinapis]